MSLFDTLLVEHGRKTVTVTSIVLLVGLVFGGQQIGWIPVIATTAYVDTVVAESTKGLSYIVEKEITEDLDGLRLQWCDGNSQLSGAISRLEDEFEELVGKVYVHKTCTALREAAA